MARRIGFGNKPVDKEPVQANDRAAPAPAKPAIAARLFGVGFLSVWLIGWTAGIVFAIRQALVEEAVFARGFLIFWSVAAIIGWIFAVRALFGLLMGKPRE